MQLPMPNAKAAQIGLCVVFFALIALVVIFGPLGEKLASLLPGPGPKTSASLQAPVMPGQQRSAPQTPSGNKAQPASVAQTRNQTSQPTLPQLPVAGNLEELTRLQAEIEEGLLRKKLAELPGKNALPLTGTARQEAPKPEPVMPVFEPKPTVVSVQGVDGQLTVTLRDRGAVATFRTGERCSAGKITRITRDAVVLQGGNGTERLFFE